jgi:hypothetical protein
MKHTMALIHQGDTLKRITTEARRDLKRDLPRRHGDTEIGDTERPEEDLPRRHGDTEIGDTEVGE